MSGAASPSSARHASASDEASVSNSVSESAAHSPSSRHKGHKSRKNRGKVRTKSSGVISQDKLAPGGPKILHAVSMDDSIQSGMIQDGTNPSTSQSANTAPDTPNSPSPATISARPTSASSAKKAHITHTSSGGAGVQISVVGATPESGGDDVVDNVADGLEQIIRDASGTDQDNGQPVVPKKPAKSYSRSKSIEEEAEELLNDAVPSPPSPASPPPPSTPTASAPEKGSVPLSVHVPRSDSTSPSRFGPSSAPTAIAEREIARKKSSALAAAGRRHSHSLSMSSASAQAIPMRERSDSLNVPTPDGVQRKGSISQFVASVGRGRRGSVTALADSLLKRRASTPATYTRIFNGIQESNARRDLVDGMTMSKVTRAFQDAGMEQAFGKYYFDISLSQVRFATWLAVAGVTLFALGDELDVGLTSPWDSQRLQVLFIRIALIASIIIFLGVTYMKFFKRHMQTTLVAVFSLAGLLFAVMSLLKQSVGVVFIAIFLLFIYLVPRLRFMYASVITVIAFVAWDIVYYLIFIYTGKQEFSVFIVYNALLILAAVLNMVTGYAMETFIRQDFLLKRTIEVEQEKTDGLLKSMLPASSVEKLKEGKHLVADQFQEVTMLMADVVGFTNLAAMLQPVELVSLMNGVYSKFDALADLHGVYKLETIGDAYMAVGGLPEPRADHADAMAEMALGMQKAMIGFNRPDGEPLQIRIGLHTGPVIAGVVGVKKMPRYWVWGETVLLSNRMEALGMPGKVHISEPTQRLLKRKFMMEEAKLDEKKTADLPAKAGQTYFLLAKQYEHAHERRSSTPVHVQHRGSTPLGSSPLANASASSPQRASSVSALLGSNNMWGTSGGGEGAPDPTPHVSMAMTPARTSAASTTMVSSPLAARD